MRRLTERIADGRRPGRRTGVPGAAAGGRHRAAGPADAVRRRRSSRRARSVAATAHTAGLGARQLHRRSLAAFGYGPKTLARVLRLQRALALVRAGMPYADAALAAGCADQAHLAREMRELAGTTLTAYCEALAKSDTAQPSGSRTTA